MPKIISGFDPSPQVSRTQALIVRGLASELSGSQTSVVGGMVSLEVGAVPNRLLVTMPRPGSIAALCVARTGNAASGTITMGAATQNGKIAGATLAVNGGTTRWQGVSFASGLYPFSRGDVLRVVFDTVNWVQTGGGVNAVCWVWW